MTMLAQKEKALRSISETIELVRRQYPGSVADQIATLVTAYETVLLVAHGESEGRRIAIKGHRFFAESLERGDDFSYPEIGGELMQ